MANTSTGEAFTKASIIITKQHNNLSLSDRNVTAVNDWIMLSVYTVRNVYAHLKWMGVDKVYILSLTGYGS